MRPPCESQPVFTDPHNHPPEDQQRAIHTCHECPLIKSCAEHALTSGGTLDKARITPATGVIQAGVMCRGDRDTAKKLATTAGVTLPATKRHPRFIPPKKCRDCGEYMIIRDKTQPTQPDVLTHGSHGYCRICDARRRRQPAWRSHHLRHSTILEGKHFGNPHYDHHRNSTDHHPVRTDVCTPEESTA